MLDLADSDDIVQEVRLVNFSVQLSAVFINVIKYIQKKKIAVEAVVFSASKKDKATGILSEGVDVLKKLYNSKNQAIKVRALVVSLEFQFFS
jgi:hypothetical protein